MIPAEFVNKSSSNGYEMKPAVTEKKIICYHCGEDCPNDKIAIDDKYFCCNGCKTVYRLLADSGLDTYYRLEDNPGQIPTPSAYGDRFAYLDLDRVKEKLFDFSEGGFSRITFALPQIHCTSCIWLLENLYRLHPGIKKSEVNFLKKTATVDFKEDDISLRQLVELLTSIGYEPTISLDNLEVKSKSKPKISIYIRLAVAGFCFANIMLLSFPEYLDSDGVIDPDFRKFFGYLNILLSLPVFFYSAMVYFKSAYHGLCQKTINMDVPISLGVVILFVRSLVEILGGYGVGYMDSFTGLVFFLLIGKLFQQKTYDSLSFERDYKSYFPISVTRKTETGEETVPVTDLKKGDHILIRNQELIPSDATLISEHADIDYSFVTGEADPIEKKEKDLIYAGGRQIGPAIWLEVVREVSRSYLTRLWNDKAFKVDRYRSLKTLSDIAGKYFTYGIITMALATALVWLFINPGRSIEIATAVLIIACPCALALSTPFTLGTAQRIMGYHKLYLKNSSVVETMAHISHIVFDKTGTLTKADSADVTFDGEELTETDKIAIKSLVKHSTHPLSLRIFQYLDKTEVVEVEHYNEIPGVGIEGIVSGRKIHVGGANSNKKTTNTTLVNIEIDNRPLGAFRFAHEYRKNLSGIINRIKSSYRMSLLSGDNDSEKEVLKKIFDDDTELIFNQRPKDKLEYIRSHQDNDQKIMMLGDGLNDAGALQQSDVGIAVSENIKAFTPASDGILAAESFEKLDKFLTLSKKSVSIILVSFVISILYNIVGLSFAVQGLLSPLVAAILMPISSITIVIFTTVSTRLAAKRIGL